MPYSVAERRRERNFLFALGHAPWQKYDHVAGKRQSIRENKAFASKVSGDGDVERSIGADRQK